MESMEISADTACSSERRKDLKMGSTILDSFSKLIKENERERLDGGISLLRHLSRKNTEETDSKELNYALKRLIRGLGSSKAISRKGFYSTLTAYLKSNPETQIEDLLKITETELNPVNSNAKSENANIYMGRILLVGALVRSQMLVKSAPEEQRKVFEILLSSSDKRSYLSYVSAFFLVDFLGQSDVKSVKQGLWPGLKKEIGKPWAEQTLDTFYVLLTMADKFPTLVGPKFFKEHLGAEEIISSEHMKDLLKLLTDIPRIVSCHHPVFKIFCEKIAESEHLLEFWSGIDERFAKPSKSIGYLGLEIFRHILTYLKDKTLIPSLLTPNFLQHMIRRFVTCKKNRQDEIATTFRSLLGQLTTVMNDKEIKAKTQVGVLKKFIFYPGDLMIEKITGTKIVQMLTANLSTDGVKKLAKLYREMASNAKPKKKKDESTEPWTNAERNYAVQLMTRLLGHPAVGAEHKWRLEQLIFLFELGLCESQNVGVELSPQFKESFYRALDHKLSKLSDLRTILSELIHRLNDELFVNKSKTLRNPLAEEAIEAWNSMMNFIGKLEKDSSSKPAVSIFHTMDLNMGLQLFSDPEMAISAIKEIHSCAERLTTKESKKKAKPKLDEDEPEWVEVIVDLMLSLLSRNNHLLRSMVKCVFPHVCPILTATSIHQILSVLDPKNDKSLVSSKREENSGASSNEEDSDSAEEEEEEEEGNNLGEGESSDSEEEEKDEEEEEEEEEDERMTDRLRLAVRQALGDASVQTDDEDIDVDDIPEEQGKRLDESLAAAFRILRQNRQNQSKKQEKSAQSVTHFRVRVIDLLETYIESGPSMALALDMLVPLFALLEYCIKDPHQKPLENRVRACLKKLSSVKKFREAEGVDAQLLTDVAKLLMKKGERSTAVCQEMGDKLAECATFLVRCVQQAALPQDTLVPLYGESLTAFFKKRDCVLPASLFKSALQLAWMGNWQLAPPLVDYAFDNTIRPFRRGQALEFLTTFYRNGRLVKSEGNDALRLEMEKKLCANSISLLRELTCSVQEANESENPTKNVIGKEVKQRFVCLLLSLLHAIYPQHLPKAWNWPEVAKAMTEYRSNVSLSKDVKSAYNKLASQIGATINVAPKKTGKPVLSNGVESEQTNGIGKSDDEDEDDDDEEKKEGDSSSTKLKKKEEKKKLKARSKRKDKQKLKKESRELRAKAMSEGLESSIFSSVKFENGTLDPVPVVNGFSEDVATGESKETKKSAKRTIQDDTPNKTKKKKKKHPSEDK